MALNEHHAMTLVLTVISYRHEPPQAPKACRFTHGGGTIGRADDSDLSLPDPERYISRAHARVELNDGGWLIQDCGSNPSVLNGRALGGSRQARLSHGDTLTIGDYVLSVVIEAAAAAPVPVAAPPTRGLDDLLSGQAAAALPDPLAGLEVRAGVPAGLDDDPLGLGPRKAGSELPDPVSGQAPRTAEPWFGSMGDTAAPQQHSFALPQATSVPAPARQPDPPPRPAAAPASSGGSMIPEDFDPFADDFAGFLPVAAESAPASPVSAAAAAGTPAAAVLPESVAAEIPPDPMAGAAKAPAALAEVSLPAFAPVPAAPAASTAAAPVPHPLSAGDGAILQALLKGLAMQDLPMAGRNGADLAELVGQMLHEALGGTMGVLLARAMTKKEIRMDMTVIGVRDNNPLKFFPDVDSALTQMLTGRGAGYLPPLKAIWAAFDDIKAHELAMIAGMRAALMDVLKRFSPDAIEGRVAESGTLGRLMPSGRKARMWDRMVEMYADMVREADDDFQRLFGDRFSSAYDEQVARLRKQ